MRRARKIVVYSLAALGALQVAVTCTPLLAWYTRYLTGPAWDAPQGDVLIVLGAESDNAGTMGIGTYWRCHTALWAWRQARYKQVVLSGGRGIAAAMADFLALHGVPSSAIVLESKSLTTAENAHFCALVLKERSVQQPPDLVTSDYHMRRASAAFRRAGVAIRCIPAPDAGKRLHNWLDRWSVFLLLAQETAKLGWYGARGFI